MAMTKRDFEAMAESVRDSRREVNYSFTEGTASWVAAQAALDTVAERLATACAGQYRGGYGFNRQRFLDACALAPVSA